MSDFPLIGSFGGQETSVNTGSGGRPLNSSGTANTKGSWFELIASTDETSDVMVMCFPDIAISGSVNIEEFLVDIAIGSAGNEEVLISNIFYSAPAQENNQSLHSKTFFIRIPSGSRIAARCQSSLGGAQLDIIVYVFHGSHKSSIGLGGFVTYGANTSTTDGVEIDPGGTVDTKGSWFEITASSDELKGFHLCAGVADNEALTAADMLVDIGIGSAGNEEVILLNAAGWFSPLENTTNLLMSDFIPLSVPDGARIAARSQCAINNDPDRKFDLVIIGAT